VEERRRGTNTRGDRLREVQPTNCRSGHPWLIEWMKVFVVTWLTVMAAKSGSGVLLFRYNR
jgi:hypothetical protein